MENQNTNSSPDTVVQNNMRVRQGDKDAFTEYCKANGLTQADAFNAAVSMLGLDSMKQTVPERAAEIDEVKKALDLVMDKYADSVRYNAEAEGRIRQEYERRLKSRDETIESLQNEKAKLNTELTEAKTAVSEARKEQSRAEEQAFHDRETRDAAEKTSEDKERINDMLQSQLADAQEKASAYDSLKKSYDEIVATQQATEQALRDQKRDAEEAARQATREAERAQEQAVGAAEQRARKEADELKNQLRKALSEADAAQKDAETARASAIAELSEKHAKEIAALREKLDERTDALLAAREEISQMRTKTL